MAKKVAILMGSDSDFPIMEKCITKLKHLGVEVECHIMSAHRTPESVVEFISFACEKNFGVIIAAAGKAAHLAGVCASYTILPIIGVPMKSDALEGIDALLSTVQMPPGIPVAAVAIDASVNAAILASEILALNDPELSLRLRTERMEMKNAIKEKDSILQKKLTFNNL